jgi:hypothetical protein
MMTPTPTEAGIRPAAALTSRAQYRWGGVAGLVFVAVVVAQNVIRGSGPANDAAASAIVRDYADHRTLHAVLAAMFVVGACALAGFVAALWNRLRTDEAGVYTGIGVLGAALVFALFSLTVAIDAALSAYVHLGAASPDVVRGLWVAHNAVFTILLVALAIALFGLASAAATAGLVSGSWKIVGAAGACLLLTAPLAAPATIEGSHIIGVAFVGFIAWLGFVCRASYALLHEVG